MKSIILASKSEVRKKILDENQIEYTVEPSNLDEDEVKKRNFNFIQTRSRQFRV